MRRSQQIRLRINGLNQRGELTPRHHLLHIFQKLRTPRLLGVPLESSRHRQCLLPHVLSESLESTLHTEAVESRELNQTFLSVEVGVELVDVRWPGSIPFRRHRFCPRRLDILRR
jgi:hypothetical protein